MRQNNVYIMYIYTFEMDTAKLFFNSAVNGNYEDIAVALAQDISPSGGDTALILASREGHVEIVRLFLEHGADLNFQDDDGNTALLEACIYGHIDVVKLLLDLGADPNIWSEYRSTPLIFASCGGYIEIVGLLLEHGANPNLQDDDGESALLEACIYGHIEIVKLLLEHEVVELNLRDKFGNTASGLALGKGYIDIAILIENEVRKRVMYRLFDGNTNSNYFTWLPIEMIHELTKNFG